MDFKLTEEQEMLRASAREFLEKECDENVIKDIEAGKLGYSLDLWKKIADLGWLGLVYPEQYGGTGMNLIDLTILYEEMGRAMFPSPYTSTIVLSGLTILEAGNDKQKSDILPEIIQGNKIIAAVINESDYKWEGMALKPQSTTITATKDGDEYLINGTKLFVHDAQIADIFLVPARTKDGDNLENGISLFLVAAESPSVTVTRLTTIPGDNQCEVIFNKVRVPAGNIVGKLHEGWAPLARSIQIETIMSASQMLGAGQQLLKLSAEDYEARQQTGIPGDVSQYNEEYLAQLRHDVDGCLRTTYVAARKLADGEPCDFELTVVSSWSSYAHQSA